MAIANKKESLILFLGDLLIFDVSVWLALFIRYREIPSLELLSQHFAPFALLFVVWVTVFFIAGLYDKHTLVLRSKLTNTLFNAQVVNAIIAIIFFYFFATFGINPKTNLLIYLGCSSFLLFVWRLYVAGVFLKQSKQNALIVGSGEEVNQILDEVNNNPRYNLHFVSSINLEKISEVDFKEEILNRVYGGGVSVIVVDFDNKLIEPILPHLYNLIFSGVRFIDLHKVYEDLFDRMPLSLLKHGWFLENISLVPKITYDIFKRMMDMIVAFTLGLMSTVFYPFVYAAIKLDDGGDIFIVQERVGKNNRPMKIVKFRTMSVSDAGKWVVANDNRITKVGKFLRKSRIDELPQLFNVLVGDISLIGPRPELPRLVDLYEKEIPYYNVRHLVKPGLSGWAQIHHEKPPHSIEETREKLAFDLYYIKNRSIMLEVKIALKTIKTLLSRSGV